MLAVVRVCSHHVSARRDHLPNSLYTFETWGQQLLDFMEQKMGGDSAFLVCNSVGGMSLARVQHLPEGGPGGFGGRISDRR